MAISYAKALTVLEDVAVRSQFKDTLLSLEELPLTQAIGRITAREYVSPIAVPSFDSSAMDGFAVVADVTRSASPDNPVIFRVQSCTLAGDSAAQTTSLPGLDGLHPCIEIMTGARFPSVQRSEQDFDAVVRIEDVVESNVETQYGSVRCIKIIRPIAANTNKRFAGGDFGKGECILRNHTTVRPHHIMVMACVGFMTVQVRRRVKVGVWSTGRELARSTQDLYPEFQVMDINGPYLEAALRELGAEVKFLGILDDDESAFKTDFRTQAQSGDHDILITTGAVSRGKLDFIPAAVKSLGATVRFHGVAMRPGHPVLFATLPSLPPIDSPMNGNSCTGANDGISHFSRNGVAFFGLPGNPVAAAACVKFLVAPYMCTLLGMQRENVIKAAVVDAENKSAKLDCLNAIGNEKRKPELDYFRHGLLYADTSKTGWSVRMSTDQSPAKVRPFSIANCWCHTRSGESSKIVDCFPF